MCYISMESPQRDLQTNEKLFSNFKLVLEILGENWKIFKRIERREYWSKWNVIYNNGFDYCEAFSKFWNHFSNQLLFFKIIVALGLCKRGGGGICAEQQAC